MIILQESASSQTINFIPRSGGYDTLVITDEQTGEVDTITTFTNTTGDYYDTITAVFTLVENHFYSLVVKDGTVELYRDKIYCTNQSIPTYSVNSGQYTNYSSNNDYVLYE
jgi:hypothetical protein